MSRFPLNIPSLVSVLRRVRHGMTVGVRVMAHDAEGRLLLVKHSYTPGWCFPGGGVDLGESAEDAARREMREETNCTITGPLVLHGVFFNPQVGGRDHVVMFRTDAVAAGPKPKLGLEIIDIRFFAPAELPADLAPATARRLAEWRDGTPLPPVW